MRVLKRLLQRYHESEARHRAYRQRVRRAYEESERLRAERSHLEREIYELWASDLPRRQKALLEEAIRVRLRRVEEELHRLETEIWHSRLIP